MSRKRRNERLAWPRARPYPFRMGDAGFPARAVFRLALLGGSALGVSMPALAQGVAPTVLPSGGRVIGGVASIARGGNTLTIQQSTPSAAINWQSFSVGSQASVAFHVPTAQSTTINRVVGPDPSVIAGRISSNGNVVIANQSGIVFTNGAQVDVNALVASAPGISAANAVAGKLVFDQPARPGAAVVNEGHITVRQTGLAALVAPEVANSGVISAKLGHVVLAGAAAATVDLYGDGLISLDVTKQVTQAPGGGMALVTNTGTIAAQGGTVRLTAAAVDGLVTNLVDAGGQVSAGTGSIVIAGTGGNVEITGQLAARGAQPGTTGGTIQANATGNVTVAPGAVLDVSGQAGGGVIAVGTTIARAVGGPSVTAPMAQSVNIAQRAALRADALAAGNGGHIAVLSSGITNFSGVITAQGGPQGGNGGGVEISGPALDFTGKVNVTAPLGTLGSILLDPGNLLIQTGGNGAVTNGQTFTADTTLDPTVIEALAGNVTLSADGSIDVTSSLNTGGSTGTGNFTLLAAGNILVNNAITGYGNQIVLIAGDPVLGGTAGSVIINGNGFITNATDGGTGFVALLAKNNITVNGFIYTGSIELLSGGGVAGAGIVGGNGVVYTGQGTVSLTGDVPGPIPFPTLTPVPTITPCAMSGISCVVPLPQFLSQIAVPMTEPNYSFIVPFSLAPPEEHDLDITLPGIGQVDF